jgi:hypothetical protein
LALPRLLWIPNCLVASLAHPSVYLAQGKTNSHFGRGFKDSLSRRDNHLYLHISFPNIGLRTASSNVNAVTRRLRNPPFVFDVPRKAIVQPTSVWSPYLGAGSLLQPNFDCGIWVDLHQRSHCSTIRRRYQQAHLLTTSLFSSRSHPLLGLRPPVKTSYTSQYLCALETTVTGRLRTSSIYPVLRAAPCHQRTIVTTTNLLCTVIII